MAKGQVSHGFLYVLTLVIFILILLFGYKMISTFRAKSDELILLKFERDVQATLESVSYGTTKIRTFEVPYGYRTFWLVDLSHAYAGGVLTPNCAPAPVEITDALASGTGQNAFLIGPTQFHAFTLERVSVASGCLQFPIKNKELELKLSKG